MCRTEHHDTHLTIRDIYIHASFHFGHAVGAAQVYGRPFGCSLLRRRARTILHASVVSVQLGGGLEDGRGSGDKGLDGVVVG